MSGAVQNRQPWLAHGYPGIRSPTPSGAPKQTWTDDCDKSIEDSFPLRYRLQTQSSADIYHLEHIDALLQVNHPTSIIVFSSKPTFSLRI